VRISDYGTFPVVSPSDELTTVETSYGPMEKWKARALAIGWFSAVTHSRSDADGPPLHDADKPPRLVADETEAEFETAFADLMTRMGRLREVRDMIKKCDEMEARCDALSLSENSRRALLDAEAEFTEDEDPRATRH
jgi:hypothetical protein